MGDNGMSQMEEELDRLAELEREQEHIRQQWALTKPPKATKPEGDGWPRPLDFAALAMLEPEPPQFIIQDWLPCGYATMFSGHGGIGKSGIALHIAVCAAMGIPFFGLPVEQRRVMYLSCEDRGNVLHWRLKHICEFHGIGLADLCGKLDALDLVGHETVFWEKDASGHTVTLALANLATRMQELSTELLFVDGISDTFGGNENSKSDVKRFINAMVGLIPPERGAVVLVGHVDKATAKQVRTGEGYSGSTGWHNGVRARWYLYPDTEDEEGEATKTGELRLERQKSNHGEPTLSELRLAWDAQARLFMCKDQPRVDAPMWLDNVAKERAAERVVLAGLTLLVSKQVPTTESTASTNYLPAKLIEWKLSEGLSRRELRDAMIRLRKDGKIDKGEVGKYTNRTPILGLHPVHK